MILRGCSRTKQQAPYEYNADSACRRMTLKGC